MRKVFFAVCGLGLLMVLGSAGASDLGRDWLVNGLIGLGLAVTGFLGGVAWTL